MRRRLAGVTGLTFRRVCTGPGRFYVNKTRNSTTVNTFITSKTQQIRKFHLSKPTLSELPSPHLGHREGLISLWVENTHLRFGPISSIVWFFFPRLANLEARLVNRRMKNLFLESNVIPEQVIHLPREGGTLLQFASKELAQRFQQYVPVRFVRFGLPSRSFLIHGKPFLEDILAAKPSKKLLISCVDGSIPITEENLFKTLRKYGSLLELKILDAQKGIYEGVFSSINGAISSRVCLHRAQIHESILQFRYEKYERFAGLKSRLKDPKILFPLLAIGITVSTILIVAPLRIFSVTQRLSIPTLGQLRESTSPYFSHYRKTFGGGEGQEYYEEYNPRKALADQLRGIVSQRSPSMVFLYGPTGGGKTTMIKTLVSKRALSVYVDCTEANSVQEFIDQFSQAIGFFPSFTLVNKSFGWFESFLPLKSKETLSVSESTQLTSMLDSLTKAIGLLSGATLPLVVIDGMDELITALEQSKDSAKAGVLLQGILNWALYVTSTKRSAHVIFVSDNKLIADELKKYDTRLSSHLFSMNVTDLDTEASMQFIKNLITTANKDNHTTLPSDDILLEAVELIGGRVSDLDDFASRIDRGVNARDAAKEIVNDVVNELKSNYFVNPESSTSSAGWTKLQLWKVIERLVQKKAEPAGVTYDEILFDIMDGNEGPLKSMIEHRLLSVQTYGDENTQSKKYRVSALSSIYMRAFEKLVGDNAMNKKMKILNLQKEMDRLGKEVDKIEDELLKISQISEHLPSGTNNSSLVMRADFLNGRLAQYSALLIDQEKQLRILKPKL